MRLALRIDDPFEPAQNAHAGKHLREAGIRFPLFLDGGNKLAVLELDAVHGDVDLRHVDAIVLAVAEVIVECFVGAASQI